MTVSAGPLAVVRLEGSHRLEGSWTDVEMGKTFLTDLEGRGFSPATVRAYAFDLLNFGRFLGDQELTVVEVVPTDLFDYLDWQARAKRSPPCRQTDPRAGAHAARTRVRRRRAPAGARTGADHGQRDPAEPLLDDHRLHSADPRQRDPA